MSNIQKVLDIGYQINADTTHCYAMNVINPDGKSTIVPFTIKLHKKFYFGPDKIMVSEKELFDYLYTLTDEEMCQFMNGYGLRTKEYFDNLCSSIGYCGYECVDDFSGSHASDNLEKTEYYYTEKYAEVDNFGEIRHYFNHNPSDYEVRVAKMIQDAEYNFRMCIWHEEFKCWECGRTVHWTDIRGDIFEKVNCMEDMYCGC